MGVRFHGWPEQAYAVLLELGGEPSRETRERVRRHREEQVRQPMIDLLHDLADIDPWYEDFAVWRYASTAYWWQNQCAIVRVVRNVEIGFRFNLDGLRINAGSLIAARELESDAVRDVEPVYRACERLRPLLGWLAEHTVIAPEGAKVAGDPR